MKTNDTLKTLELGYNPIGPDGAAAMAGAVKYFGKVDVLRLGWCKIEKQGSEHIADALRYNSTMSTLDLRGNNLGDEGAAHLAASLQVTVARVPRIATTTRRSKVPGGRCFLTHQKWTCGPTWMRGDSGSAHSQDPEQVTQIDSPLHEGRSREAV